MKNLLNQARQEILVLRRENEILRAKVDVMDLFACVLHTAPNGRRQSMAEDVAWKLQKKLDEIDAAERAERNTAVNAQ